ncbi:hypothetical protein D0Z07_3629 [Hyphodiscus hymeniophilus]|uniref:BTB domain-containing protein n=1 Tax=Hyphodiscus hymeniophilus TaxID=353542 RepID=A0A9P6VJZ3_9HELO|nr:hypothetical protein D0Z07_3629 [Hyphodiscus hymeniophilus]
MVAPFSKALNSRLFKFTVGGEVDDAASEYFLHEDAVAQLSSPLEKMMKGGVGGKFSEAQAGATAWPSVRKVTFECFAEFAYTCDYSIPEPVVREVFEGGIAEFTDDAEDIPRCELEPNQDPWSQAIFSRKDKSKLRRSEKKCRQWPEESVDEITEKPRYSGPMLAESFQTLAYPLLSPRNHSAACDLILPFSKTSSYQNILLCHATLYILADLWMIDSLKALTLFKLHAMLCAFKLNDKNAEDIVGLARYAYQEGPGSDGGIGGLRNLICQYMASNAVVLSLDAGFIALLEEGGPLVETTSDDSGYSNDEENHGEDADDLDGIEKRVKSKKSQKKKKSLVSERKKKSALLALARYDYFKNGNLILKDYTRDDNQERKRYRQRQRQ